MCEPAMCEPSLSAELTSLKHGLLVLIVVCPPLPSSPTLRSFHQQIDTILLSKFSLAMSGSLSGRPCPQLEVPSTKLPKELQGAVPKSTGSASMEGEQT